MDRRLWGGLTVHPLFKESVWPRLSGDERAQILALPSEEWQNALAPLRLKYGIVVFSEDEKNAVQLDAVRATAAKFHGGSESLSATYIPKPSQAKEME